MARQKQTKRQSTPSNPSFRGFLNIDLSDEDRAIIKSNVYDGAAWQADLDKWIDSGFKFTFSYDDYNHCFQCIAARISKDHVDYGILVTGRGSTAIKSFKQWLYIQTRLVGDATWTELLDNGVSHEIDD